MVRCAPVTARFVDVTASLSHVFVLNPDIAPAEWSLLEFVNLNFHATAVEHLCHFAKILVHAAQSVEHLLMKFVHRHWRTRRVLHRLQTNLQTPVDRLVFIAADLKRIQLPDEIGIAVDYFFNIRGITFAPKNGTVRSLRP